MTSEFVEGIVTQIRKRIAEVHTQKARPQLPDLPAHQDFRERMAEDSRCFVDLDTKIAAAAVKIGESPPVPPTWGGRIHLGAVSLLQRALGWYTKPLQETIELLNRRNREQAARHLQMQEQILSLMNASQQAMNRTERLDSLQQDIEGQLWELRSNQTAVQSQTHFISERTTKLGEAERQRGNSLWVHIGELQTSLQELRASNAVSDSVRSDLEQRLSELAQAFWSRLPVLETQLQVEADAHRVLAVDINCHVNRLEQELRKQTDELTAGLRDLQAHAAVSDSLRAEMAQRVSDGAHAAWDRLLALETLLREEGGARETLAKEVSSHLHLFRTLENQFSRESVAREALANEVSSQLKRLRTLETQLRGEASAREALANEIGSQLARLLTIETRLRADGDAREALAKEVTGHLERLKQELGSQIEERFQELPVSSAEEPVTSLYAEFEDLFRGPREEIKERLKVYIPRLQQSTAGSSEAPVLDLGSGRGEWLQLLSEHDFIARGVDINPNMISRCSELGLDAVQSDALAYLRSLPDCSLGAITSFHMIEHVPFEALMAIVDEAMRVVQSGGLLILETPNPQNVLVGSQTFWIDPTHIHPVLSQTLRFFVEARGFCQVEILNLQPYPEAARVPEDSAVAKRFNEYFYGPQDYSVIGYRP